MRGREGKTRRIEERREKQAKQDQEVKKFSESAPTGFVGCIYDRQGWDHDMMIQLNMI